MKCQQFSKPQSGELVLQLRGSLTFADDLHLGHSRDHWKGMDEEKKIVKGITHSFVYSVP